MISWTITVWAARIRVQTYLLTLEWLSLHFVVRGTLLFFLSHWAYRAGYFLGTHTRTPELASVYADRNVLLGTFSPQELRWYAWGMLWIASGTILWSIHFLCKSLEVHQAATHGISPKIPVPSQSIFFPEALPTKKPGIDREARRVNVTFRLQSAFIGLCFAFAFIKKQHVGKTLIFHSVHSPLILEEPSPQLLSLDDHATHTRFEETISKKALHNLPYSVHKYDEPVVPAIVHFVFGLNEKFGEKPFGYTTYLSIYSGLSHEPQGNNQILMR